MRIQTAPAKRWTERERLGAQGGGMNGGIFVVSDKNKRGYIEKRMQRRDIEHQIAEREITALQRVGHHPYITTMVDHFIDYRRGEASIYLERCTGSSLQRLIERHARNHNEMIAEYYLWNWFMQIAEALSYCHYGPRPDHPPSRQSWNSIYHRDGEYDSWHEDRNSVSYFVQWPHQKGYRADDPSLGARSPADIGIQ